MSRRYRYAQIVFVFAIAEVVANVAMAYSVSGGKWSQPGGLGSPVTITYSYQNMFEHQNAPGEGLLMPSGERLPDLLIRNSIEEALGAWASVAPLQFVEVRDDGRSYAQGSTQYGQIRFRHVYINGPDPPPPAQPVAKARAYFPASSVLAGDVEYDHGDPWQEVGTTPVPDILGATVHELGHSLGLNHSALEDANMFWIFTRFSGPGTAELFEDDILGIRAIYGAGVGSVTPLAGLWQDRPILPSTSENGRHVFDHVDSGMWFDPPLTSSYEFIADSDTLFSQILDFPAGFDAPFTLSVDGNVVGQFNAGDSFSFASLPGGGASQFTISGISPLADVDDPLGFPLKLAFTTSTGSFSMQALNVPEPGAITMLIAVMLASARIRRRDARSRPCVRQLTTSGD